MPAADIANYMSLVTTVYLGPVSMIIGPLVPSTLGRVGAKTMAGDGHLMATYRKWFLMRAPTGEDLELPMSLQLTEAFRSMGAEGFF